MSTPHESQTDELEAIFEEDERRQLRDEAVVAAKDRLAAFLTEHGVLMAVPPEVKSDVETDEYAELSTHVAVNHIIARTIAARLVVYETVDVAPGTDVDEWRAGYKKKLQADLTAAGCDAVWMEAVDAQLPGDSLESNRDADLIAETIAEHADRRAIIAARTQLIYERFCAEMGCGPEELSDEERHALSQLIGAYSARQSSPKMQQRTAWSEEARIYLLDQGITITPRLNRIICFE